MTATQPVVQVLVDWQNNPLGVTASAGDNFTDISEFVRFDQGLTSGRGRQDNISVVQPSRCTFTVHNDDGRFTPGNMSSPYAPVKIGRRVQVNVKDETGTWNTRFDGMIAEFNVVDTPNGRNTMMRVVCSDVLAFLNRYPGFSCWTVQECANQGGTPVFQYLCDEDSSAGALKDSTGNNGSLAPAVYANPPYTTQATDSGSAFWDAPTITYQGGSSPVEGAVDPLSFDTSKTYGFPVASPIKSPLASVQFTQTLENSAGANTTAAASAQFQGPLTKPVTVNTGVSFTLLGWVWTASDNPGIATTSVHNAFEAICLSNTRTGSMLAIGADDSGGDVTYRCKYYANYLKHSPSSVSTSGPDTASDWLLGAPLMVAVVVDGTSANFYAAGNVYKEGQKFFTGPDTLTLTAGTVFNWLSIGGPIGGGNGWVGNISLVTMFDSALTTDQLADLAQFGSVGSEGQTTGALFSRIAFDYTGLPSYWQGTVDTGLSIADYEDITDNNPSTIIQDLQAVEAGGLVFVDAGGKLNFHDRSRRMGATTTPVTLPAGSYNPGISPKINDQFLINLTSYANGRSGSGSVVQDQDSIDAYGVYPNGSITSPVQAPYVSFAFTTDVLSATNPSNFGFYDLYDDRNIYDAAAWDVNTFSEPALKLASVTVDTLGNTSASGDYIAPSTLYGLEINQPVITEQDLDWWPNNALASELFIEGINETYSDKAATIEFYTTPASQGRAWIPGDSTYGQLDVSARVGISKTSGLSRGSFLWPATPDYETSMNLGAGAAGFVGATDQAGISENLQRLVQPPLLFVTQKTTNQSFLSFGGGNKFITWDNTLLDTLGSFNLADEGAVSYTVLVAGWYEVYTTVVFGSPSSTALYTVMITHVQGTAGVRQLAPATAKGTTGDLGITTSAVVYLQTGDNVSVSVTTNASSWSTSVSNGGSSLSLRYLGQGVNRN